MAPTTLDLAPATPASSSATPTTRHPLPHYKGKQIDNTDLLDSIDRVGTKLAETLALVSSIQSQPNKQVTTTHNRSTRPARASHPARLGMDLVVTSTPEGCSVRRRPAPTTGLRISEYEASMENYQAQPYGLRNFVNMVQIEEYQEGSIHIVQEGGSSSPSDITSNASVHTELQHHDDEGVEYDLDIVTPRYYDLI